MINHKCSSCGALLKKSDVENDLCCNCGKSISHSHSTFDNSTESISTDNAIVHGIGGWMYLFAFSIVSTILIIIAQTFQSDQLVLKSIILRLDVLVFGVIAGYTLYSLFSIKENAISLVKSYLILNLLSSVLNDLITKSNNIVWAIVYTTIWGLYFSKSNRIKNTFNDIHLKKKDSLILIGCYILSVIIVLFYNNHLNNNYIVKFRTTDDKVVNGTVFFENINLGETENGIVNIGRFKPGFGEIIAMIGGKQSYYEWELDSTDIDYAEMTILLEGNEYVPSTGLSMFYEQYLEKVITNNLELRKIAIEKTKFCGEQNIECQIITLYDYVLSEFSYYSDPIGSELIQTPQETIELEGGDCEDLSVLLSSLLSNIGIETSLGFTEDHVFVLAYGANLDIMKEYIYSQYISETELVNINKSFSLSPSSGTYFGGDSTYNSAICDYWYSIDSSQPLEVFFVDDEINFNQFISNEDYSMIQNCYHDATYSIIDSCSVNNTGGIVLFNPNNQDAEINFTCNAVQYDAMLEFDEIELNLFTANEKTFISLDPTLGNEAYAGMLEEIPKELTIISVSNRKLTIVNN
jgi:hypothetical protein